MKKTIVTIVIAASACVATQAQGLVHFNNNNSTLVSTNTVPGGAATGVTDIASNGSFYYALFAAASGTTVGGSTAATAPGATQLGTFVFNAANAASWTQVAVGTNTMTAGRFASTTADASANTALPGLSAGTAYAMVVLGWSANLGNSVSALETALAGGQIGFLGESVVGTITPGNGTSIPSSAVFGTGSPFIQGFTLGVTPIPEPGTLALAALGGASMFLFRRKK